MLTDQPAYTYCPSAPSDKSHGRSFKFVFVLHKYTFYREQRMCSFVTTLSSLVSPPNLVLTVLVSAIEFIFRKSRNKIVLNESWLTVICNELININWSILFLVII